MFKLNQMLQIERDKIANTVLFLVGILSFVPVSGSVFRAFDIGWQPVMSIHMVVLTSVWCIYFFRKHINYSFRCGWVVLIFMLGGMAGTIQLGVIGNGMTFMVFSTILGSLLFSPRFGAGLAVLGVLTIVFGGYLSIVHQNKPNFDLSLYVVSPHAWGDILFSFGFITVVLVIALTRQYQSLIQALKTANIRNEEIQLLVEERTQQLEEANNKLHKLAEVDSLTGLLNRRVFENRLNYEIERSGRNGSPLSLLMLDIDHFKSINDAYGHPVGDKVLASTARVMSMLARRTDVVARFGGEEFAIALPDTNLELALSIAKRIRRKIESRREESESISVTVSIGVTLLREGETSESLITRADRALYTAKNYGRNRVEVEV